MGDDIEYQTLRFERGIIDYSFGFRCGEMAAAGWRQIGVLLSDETGSKYVVFERTKPEKVTP